MGFKEFSKELERQAASRGMCAMGREWWKGVKSMDDLLELYKKGIEFIIDNPSWITCDLLLEKCGRAKLHRHGIYVDDVMELDCPQMAVLNGNCDMTVRADEFTSPEIYVRDNSRCRLEATDNAIVSITVYEGASVDIDCRDDAKCYVYVYGGEVRIKGDGEVLVRNRRGLSSEVSTEKV